MSYISKIKRWLFQIKKSICLHSQTQGDRIKWRLWIIRKFVRSRFFFVCCQKRFLFGTFFGVRIMMSLAYCQQIHRSCTSNTNFLLLVSFPPHHKKCHLIYNAMVTQLASKNWLTFFLSRNFVRIKLNPNFRCSYRFLARIHTSNCCIMWI